MNAFIIFCVLLKFSIDFILVMFLHLTGHAFRCISQNLYLNAYCQSVSFRGVGQRELCGMWSQIFAGHLH